MVDPNSNIEKAIDLGFVGDPDKVDLTLLNQLIGHELIPVLAPLATSHDGQTLNVNADTFCRRGGGRAEGQAAAAFDRRSPACSTSRRSHSGIVGEGCAKTDRRRHHFRRHDPEGQPHLRAGTGRAGVVIIDGKTQHAVLLELFTNQGTGTLIHK